MAVYANQMLVGNIGQVYEMRTVGKDNREVIEFSIAVTPRKQVDGEWTDGETYWMNVTAWNKLAVNVKASFKSGDRVFVSGRTDMKPAYTNKEGKEIPARPFVIADVAGHEISNHSAQTDRVAGQRRDSDGARPYNNSSNHSSNSNSAPRTQKKAAAPINDNDLNFDDDDFDVDLNTEDSPF